MNSEEIQLERLVLDFYSIGVFKFGNFLLKSGITSPIYVDFRILPSFPKILKQTAEMIWSKWKKEIFVNNTHICGVPYSALPLAASISLGHELPMLIVRKEGPKKHGTKQQVEGNYTKGESTCVLLEDVITTGESVSRVADLLESTGIRVTGILAVLDRECHTTKNFRIQKSMRSLLTLQRVLNILQTHAILKDTQREEIRNFLESTSTAFRSETNLSSIAMSSLSNPVTLKGAPTFSERALLCSCELGRRLFTLMDEKKTNLCIAADVTTKNELLELAMVVGPHICMLKTHIDIIRDFDQDLIEKLSILAESHRFLLFEDRKFADIGNTMKMQYAEGPFRISSWAHITTCHMVSGDSGIASLRQVAFSQTLPETKCISRDMRGLLLVSSLSSTENQTREDAKVRESPALDLVIRNNDFVFGLVGGGWFSGIPQGLVYCMAGVHLQAHEDNLGQHYVTPECAILERGADIVIVGRGVLIGDRTSVSDRVCSYRKASWQAYQMRCTINSKEPI